MTPVVSILIPAYNAEKWIKETVTSALNQTWTKKEIIIVDDGSTDNTAAIVRRFGSSIVKLISQQNGGSCAARNKAFSVAQGDYIQWLDHDDLLHPDKISLQMKESGDGTRDQILYSGSFGQFYYRVGAAKFKPDSLWQDLAPIDYYLIKFNENTWLHPTTWLVSRKLTESAGPWLDFRTPDDDGEYFCRVVAASNKIKYVPEAKSYWRIGNYGSLSKQISSSALTGRFLSIKLCIDHLRSLEDSERTRQASLNLLKTWLLMFYPEQTEILKEIRGLYQELGEEFTPPKISMKYYLIQQIFGWRVAKTMMYNWRRSKETLYRDWDKLQYHLAGNNKAKGV